MNCDELISGSCDVYSTLRLKALIFVDMLVSLSVTFIREIVHSDIDCITGWDICAASQISAAISPKS